jgi:hypothetical protein
MMSLGLYCNESGVAAESSGMVACLLTRCSGRHWTANTVVVELIVRCVQFRSALTTNDTGFGSTKHEQSLIVVSRVYVLPFYVEAMLRSGSAAAFWAAGAAARGNVI